MLFDQQHLNPAARVHGGALMTLLDHAISSTAWEACDRQPCVTVQMDTQFLGAVEAGQFAQGVHHLFTQRHREARGLELGVHVGKRR